MSNIGIEIIQFVPRYFAALGFLLLLFQFLERERGGDERVKEGRKQWLY
jgi:hypothetical protein